MRIDPSKQTYQENYKLMIGSIVPRPIAFVSTLAADGTPNLAPFSYFTAITSEPPTVCFSPGYRPRPDGARKDTLANIEATREFVINVVTEELGPAMSETAVDYPPGTNEFEVAGLTPAPSDIVKVPRVAESPISMECKLYEVHHIGPKRIGGGALVIGEVVMFHIDDSLYEDGRIDIARLKPLGRLAGADYTTLGRIISLQRKVPKR